MLFLQYSEIKLRRSGGFVQVFFFLMSKACICAFVSTFLVKKNTLKCYFSCVGTRSQSETAARHRLNPELFPVLCSCADASAVLGRARAVHAVVRGQEELLGASVGTWRTWSSGCSSKTICCFFLFAETRVRPAPL